MPIMLLITVLALFGLFGITDETVSRTDEGLEVTVSYSGRTRYQAGHDLEIEVSNLRETPLEGVIVALNRELIDTYSSASFMPSPSVTRGGAYLFDLGTIPESGSKAVAGRVAAGRYWSRPGTVTVTASDDRSVEVEFVTFVYP